MKKQEILFNKLTYNIVKFVVGSNLKLIIMKEIHFYLDINYMHIKDCYYAYDETEDAINNKEDIIHTTSIANISFDLLDLGYRIFVHRNGRVLECKLGSMDGTEKEIRKAHNILKLIMGHVFDRYFETGE